MKRLVAVHSVAMSWALDRGTGVNFMACCVERRMRRVAEDHFETNSNHFAKMQGGLTFRKEMALIVLTSLKLVQPLLKGHVRETPFIAFDHCCVFPCQWSPFCRFKARVQGLKRGNEVALYR